MKITGINNKNIAFLAGKSFLYTDFDGTFLPQSLKEIYDAPRDLKPRKVRALSCYFQDFQDYIDKTKGDFVINISTGRRFDKDKKNGFKYAYQRMQKEGIILPKINSLITSNGGDVHYFNFDGTINSIPDKDKANEVKVACGWDSDEVKKALDDISKKMNVSYHHMRHSRNYKFSIVLDDFSKTDEFMQNLKAVLNEKMSVMIEPEYSRYPNESAMNGIKIQPDINTRRLKKDFDVKSALKKAIKNDDFVIFAGNEDNDKEALNIFNYLKNPPKGKMPTSVDEIDDSYIAIIRKEIESLPLKILFIEPPKGTTNKKTLELLKFMQKTSELFPDKVEIVKQTELGENNNFLDAIKCAIKKYSKTNKVFAKKYKNNMYSNLFKKATFIALPLLFFGGCFKKIFDKFIHKKEDE